jgi:diaminopimelate epimerase
MTIPFIKAHGAGNDFLFTFSSSLPQGFDGDRFPGLAKAICHRHTGLGADGWYLIDHPVPPASGAQAGVRLWNADGSKAELSGNGARCACAILVDLGMAAEEVRVSTGSGLKTAWLRRRDEDGMWFEMEMGVPSVAAANLRVEVAQRDATVLDVGNPQCAVPVTNFDFNLRDVGSSIEDHPRFAPTKTNVSFFRKIGPRSIYARFWERGAHHTLSSGTGSLGAAVAAILRGMVESPVTVETEFCPMTVRWDGPSHPAYLTGPARIVARGEFEY